MDERLDITIRLSRREDGGIRVSSPNLPGLILSGNDDDELLACIGPAIKALLSHRGAWPPPRTPAAEERNAADVLWLRGNNLWPAPPPRPDGGRA